MGFKVTIEQFEETIDVEEGETILERALNLSIDYPFSCQQGQCGSCKSLLVSGSVDMGHFYNPLACTDDERKRGLILACQSVPLSDVVVSITELDGVYTHMVRDLDCRILAIEAPCHDIRIIRLEIASGGPFNFVAGQYAEVTFADLPFRKYSMANRPDKSELEFHIRLMPDGLVSSYVAAEIKVGDAVRVRGPFGTSYLHDEYLGPMLAVAGGSGLAPIKSIVETALHSGMSQPIHVYHGVKDEPNVYLEAELRALAERHRNLQVTTCLSAPSAATDRRGGNLCDVIAEDFDDFSGFRAYLAGPPDMCETTREVLLSLGLNPDYCLMDPFLTAADIATR